MFHAAGIELLFLDLSIIVGSSLKHLLYEF